MPEENNTEVYTPVKMYKDRFKDDFARRAKEVFDKFVETANIDEAANAKLVEEIHRIEKLIKRLLFYRKFWRFVRNLLITLAVIFVLYKVAFYLIDGMTWDRFTMDVTNNILIPVGILMAFAAVIILVAIRLKFLNRKIENTQALLKKKKTEAWEMMWPLNRQFQWETLNNLIMQTVPSLKIDRIFNVERYLQLCKDFGLEDFGYNCSVDSCQSGTFNGNPYVLADVLSQEGKTLTYYGSRTISYTVKQRYMDSNGRWHDRYVTKYETLTASVDAWAPTYHHYKMLIFGHEAAPSLTFFRTPNECAANERKRKKTIAELEKKSLDPKLMYTMVDNQDFEASFYAINRSNEQQFRVLFGPASQQDIFNLLKDKEEGYGDDFSFEKKGMINILSADHMAGVDFSSDPQLVRDYDFKKVKEKYFLYSTEYFRNFYFSFAPLFCIQDYHQPNYRHLQMLSQTKENGEPLASPIEYETLANYMGESQFENGFSATKSILKTKVLNIENGVASVSVLAQSFSKVERWAYVPMRAGNDHYYDVPVRYYEFNPLTRESVIKVCYTGAPDSMSFANMTDGDGWKKLVEGLNVNESTMVFRRGLAAFIASNSN